MKKDLIIKYNEAIFDTDKRKAFQIIDKALLTGYSPEEIVFDLVVPAVDHLMDYVSEKMEINLAQHFFASQIACEITEKLILKFATAPVKSGCVILGTSLGDFHGLGKRIVAGCLKIHMIDTIDLGLNISPEKFVEQASIHKANVIAISSMMYHTATGENGCLMVRKILRERHLEDKIKIIVGGAPYRFDHQLFQIVQADAWAENGNSAGTVINGLIQNAQPW